jgi:hypothetical protein
MVEVVDEGVSTGAVVLGVSTGTEDSMGEVLEIPMGGVVVGVSTGGVVVGVSVSVTGQMVV